MSRIDSANPSQEYPDMVGARPTNPFAASFKPFIPASAHSAELTWPQLITGTILGNLRRVVALSCAQSRIDGKRADTGGRAFNHNLSHCVESSRRPRSIAREPRESSVKWGRPSRGTARGRAGSMVIFAHAAARWSLNQNLSTGETWRSVTTSPTSTSPTTAVRRSAIS